MRRAVEAEWAARANAGVPLFEADVLAGRKDAPRGTVVLEGKPLSRTCRRGLTEACGLACRRRLASRTCGSARLSAAAIAGFLTGEEVDQTVEHFYAADWPEAQRRAHGGGAAWEAWYLWEGGRP